MKQRARRLRGVGPVRLALALACAGLALEGSAQTPAQATEELPDPAAERSGQSAAPAEARLPAAEGRAAHEEQAAFPVVTRLEALIELNRLAEEEHYDVALPVAERLIELTEAEFGADSMEAADAYQQAARVQREAGEHVLAEQNYLHAVELIRNIDGTFSERAIDPLLGLGDSYHDDAQFVNAITAYNEARTISRRVYGLLNEGQLPILDRITDSFEGMNQFVEAEEHQLEILHLAQRNHPEGSPEHLEAIYRYAAWLRESSRYTEERTQYTLAMRLIRNNHGKESPLIARALRELGNSYRAQNVPSTQGLNALHSALEILELQADEDPLEKAKVLRDIGDWEIAFSRIEPDLTFYRTAWQLLGQVEEGEALRRQWFYNLHQVLEGPISQRGLSREPGAASGYVIVQFGVDTFGRTHDVGVAESEPPGLMDEAIVRGIRQYRFRPFMEDGEIVPKADVAYRINFQYSRDEPQEG